MNLGMPLTQPPEHGHQPVKALLMGFGPHRQEHLLVGADLTARQPGVGVGVGRKPRQWPGHRIGQTQLGTGLHVLG